MEKKDHILVIDDEPNNLRLLQIDLEDAGYSVLTAEDGQKGWDLLQKKEHTISTILLDRMMPNMDGLEFMALIKKEDDLKHIPVIMQTAAAEKEQIVEGIKAGVYYYLTKPYEHDVMLSITASAIEDFNQHNRVRDESKIFHNKPTILRECKFEIQTLDEVESLSLILANIYPDPNKVLLGISELLLNAVEHGNLGITFEEKTQLKQSGTWQQEIIKRLTQLQYKDKTAKVSLEKKEKEIELIIEDQGNGFDWNEYLNISPERAAHSHGRGIALSSMLSFDNIEFVAPGNKVICTVYT